MIFLFLIVQGNPTKQLIEAYEVFSFLSVDLCRFK